MHGAFEPLGSSENLSMNMIFAKCLRGGSRRSKRGRNNTSRMGGWRKARVEALEGRRLLAIDFPSATPVEPLGGLVYSTELNASIDGPGVVETLHINLDPGQSFSVLLDAEDSLRSSFSVLDPEGQVIAEETQREPGAPLFIQSIEAEQAGQYSILVGGEENSVGAFSASLLINGIFEQEAHGGTTNDGIPEAQYLPLIDLHNTTASIASVVGTASPTDAVSSVSEDFESGELSERWQAHSGSNAGRIEVSSATAGQGNHSLSLEVQSDGGALEHVAAEGQVVVIYDPATGELSIAPSSPLITLEINSADAIFTGETAQNLGGPFGVDRDDRILKIDPRGFEGLSFGNVAQTGLTLDFLNQDLTILGKFASREDAEFKVIVEGGTSNEVTYELDGSILPQTLTFLHSSVADDPNPLPATFSNSIAGDGVAISWDGGQNWKTLFTPTSVDQDWTLATIDLREFTADSTAPVQLRFQQFEIQSDNVARRAFDHVQVIGSDATGGDWFRIPIPPEESLAVSATAETAASNLKLELRNEFGDLLATSAPSTSAAATINRYRNRTDDVQEVWAQVTGDEGTAYTMSAATDAMFDFGVFGAHSMAETGNLIGYIESGEIKAFDRPGRFSTVTVEPVSDGPGEFDNDVVLGMSFVDGTGAVVSEGQLQDDGRTVSARVTQEARRLLVRSITNTSGEYLLTNNRPLSEATPVASASVNPAGTIVELQFDRTLLSRPSNGATYSIDGQPLHDTQISQADGRTVHFTLDSPLLDATYTLDYSTMDAEYRTIEGSTNFTVNRSGPRVLTTSVADGGLVSVRRFELTLGFDDAIDRGSLSVEDVQLVGNVVGPVGVTSVEVVDANQIVIQVFDLPVDDYTLTLRSGPDGIQNQSGHFLDGEPGALPSGDGVSGGDFVMSFTNLPLLQPISFEPIAPLELPTWQATIRGTLTHADDVQLFDLPLRTPQQLSLEFQAEGDFNPLVEIISTSGESVVSLQANAVGAERSSLVNVNGDDYIVRVTSADGSLGTFDLNLRLNVAGEVAANNFTLDTALPMGAYFRDVAFGGQMASVVITPPDEGTPAVLETVLQFDFEDGTMPADWTIETTATDPDVGVRVANTHGAAHGSFALLMDGQTIPGDPIDVPAELGISYDPSNGNVSLLIADDVHVVSLEMKSASQVFTGTPPQGASIFRPDKLFIARGDGLTGNVDLGPIATPGLTPDFLKADLDISSATFAGVPITTEIVGASRDFSTENTVIIPVDLTRHNSPIIEFSHAVWNDEVLPPVRTLDTRPRLADGISVGLANGLLWVPLFTPPEQPDGEWRDYSIELSQLLADERVLPEHLQDEILIAFQGHSDSAIPNGGRAYDRIQIRGVPEDPSYWVQIPLSDRQQTTILVSSHEDSRFRVRQLELYDQNGTLLFQPGSRDTAIRNFVDTTSNGVEDHYYLRIFDPSSAHFAVNVTRDLGVWDPTEFDQSLLVTESLLVWNNSFSFIPFNVSANDTTLGTVDISPNPTSEDVFLRASWNNQILPFGESVTLTNVPQGQHGVSVDGISNRHFVLHVDGERSETFNVQFSNPFNGQRVNRLPRTVTLNFATPLRTDTVDAGDFFINGRQAPEFSHRNPNQIQIPIEDEGVTEYTISVPEGALTDISGRSIVASEVQFTIDNQAPRIVSMNLEDGQQIPAGQFELLIEFDEPINTFEPPIRIINEEGDIQDHWPTFFDVQQVGTLLNFPEGIFTLQILSNNIRDWAENRLDGEANDDFPTGNGEPGGDHTIQFLVDHPAVSVPRFSPQLPGGTGVYVSESIRRTITEQDVDQIDFELRAEQTVALRIRPIGDFIPVLSLRTPDGASSPLDIHPNEDELVTSPITTAQPGRHTIEIEGENGSIGSVQLELVFNSEFEREELTGNSNDQPTSPEPLVFLDSPVESVSRANVGGRLASSDDVDWFRLGLADQQSAFFLLTNRQSQPLDDVRLEIYDASGQLLAADQANTESRHLRISDFRVSTNDEDPVDYFVRISGASGDYQLTVTRDAWNGVAGMTVDPAGRPLDLSEFGAVFGYAAAIVEAVEEVEPNDLDNAQRLDRLFQLTEDENVTNSELYPHVTIEGTGDGTFDHYVFEVTQPNSFAIFDIDQTFNLDSYLTLMDLRGNVLASNDDNFVDVGSSTGLDSFITYEFANPGTYIIQVGSCCISPVFGGSYQLHVTLENAIPQTSQDAAEYALSAEEGDAVTIQLHSVNAALTGGVERMTLFDPMDNFIASASTDNGTDALIQHVASTAGTFRVTIDLIGNVQSEYLLTTTGSTAGDQSFRVLESSVSPGQHLKTQPETVTMIFSGDVRVDTLQPEDILLDGVAVESVELRASNSISIRVPNLDERTYLLQLQGDSIGSVNGKTVENLDIEFTYDETPPRVIASSLSPDAVLESDQLSVELQFDERLDISTLNSETITLANSFDVIAPEAIAFETATNSATIAFSGLVDDEYQLRLSNTLATSASVVTDLAGNPLDGAPSAPLPSGNGDGGTQFVIPFAVQLGTAPYDGSFLPLMPDFGNLAYITENRQFAMAGENDVDARTYHLQAGQLLNARFTRVDAGVSFTAVIRDPQGQLIAELDGRQIDSDTVLSTPLHVDITGDYTFEVSNAGGANGRVGLELLMNIGHESEHLSGETNDTRETAEDLDLRQSFLGNTSVLAGTTVGNSSDWFTFAVDDGQTFSLALTGVEDGGLRLFGPDSQLQAVSDVAGNSIQWINGFADQTTNGQPDRYWVAVDAAVDELFGVSLRRDGVFQQAATSLSEPQQLFHASSVLGRLQAGATDRYRFQAAADNQVTIDLTSIWQAEGGPDSDWKPVMRVIDSSGQEIIDGRGDEATNSIHLAFPIAVAGEYTIEIASEPPGSGDYSLAINGATLETATRVVSVDPADLSTTVFPSSIDLTFGTSVNLSTVRPDRVLIAGVPALGFAVVDARTIRLEVDTAAIVPVPTTEYAIEVAAGAVSDIAGRESAAFRSTFTARIGTADVDENGRIDQADLLAFCQVFRSGGNDLLRIDFNGDGAATVDDLNVLAMEFLGTRFGDVNLDNRFDSSDLVDLFASGRYETDVEADWYQGDTNCDQRFDSEDLVHIWTLGGFEDPSNRGDDVIVNGSFESGDFVGWDAVVTGDPFQPWTVSREGAGGGFSFTFTEPQDGSFVAWNGFDGGGPMQFQMWQDFVIPANADLASIRWQDRIQWEFFDFDPEPREYRVQLRDPATDEVLMTLYSFSTDERSLANTGWQTHLVDVSDFIGQEVRLFFEEDIPQSFTGPAQIEFDGIWLNTGN